MSTFFDWRSQSRTSGDCEGKRGGRREANILRSISTEPEWQISWSFLFSIERCQKPLLIIFWMSSCLMKGNDRNSRQEGRFIGVLHEDVCQERFFRHLEGRRTLISTTIDLIFSTSRCISTNVCGRTTEYGTHVSYVKRDEIQVSGGRTHRCKLHCSWSFAFQMRRK